MKSWEPTSQVKAERSSRNGIAARCSPPRRIRVTEKAFGLGDIVCTICGEPFRATA